MNFSIRPSNLSFRAQIHKTEGLYHANMAADKMLGSNNPEEVNLANEYKQSLQTLERDKLIDGIEVVRYYPNDSIPPRYYPNKSQGVWIDNTLLCRGEKDMIPESFTALNKDSNEDQMSYKTIKAIIHIADSIDTISKLKYQNGRCDYYGIGAIPLNRNEILGES